MISHFVDDVNILYIIYLRIITQNGDEFMSMGKNIKKLNFIFITNNTAKETEYILKDIIIHKITNN